MGARIRRVGGSRSSSCETDDGWPLLVRYASGHERTKNTAFFTGIRTHLDRRTIIAHRIWGFRGRSVLARSVDTGQP
jgi:hypothetical protein